MGPIADSLNYSCNEPSPYDNNLLYNSKLFEICGLGSFALGIIMPEGSSWSSRCGRSTYKLCSYKLLLCLTFNDNKLYSCNV